MGFQQGLSGLNAAARNLDVIGNNVANTNTVGAKSSRAEFADLYATSMLGGGSSGIGIGVTLADVAQQFTQGDISTTNNPLDVAITGNGFFQMSTNGALSYTRNGQFKLDAQGFITNSQGARLQGHVRDDATGALGQTVTDMRLPVTGIAPKGTDTAAVELNLDARVAVPTAAFNPAVPTTYSGLTSMSVYSPQGQPHTLAMYFRKTADNAWQVNATLDGTAFPTNPVSTFTFGTNGLQTAPAPVALTVPFPAGEGGPLPVSVDLKGVTQYGSPFVVNSLEQNGYGSGDLAGFTFGADGKLLARYTNGRTQEQGELTLVNFRNAQGLQAIGANQWVETAKSGVPNQPQAPGTGNLGQLQAGALEQSNVDLTGELVSMITAQRVYQANAQTIKAQDQLLQTIVNLR
jgi:flagellar hook protein FlgE